MIQYRHKKTGFVVKREKEDDIFLYPVDPEWCGPIASWLIDGSNDWERILPEVKTYPAELVEPLLNCRMENVWKYQDALREYKAKIQNS